MYVHKLEELFRADAERWKAFQADVANDDKLKVNWSTVKTWENERRYDTELLDITRRMSAESDQLMRIELISPKQPLYQALRSVFGTTASVECARLGSTQIGGRYIDDAYLYEIR